MIGKNYALCLLLFCTISIANAQTKKDKQEVEALIENSFDELFSNFKADDVSLYYTDDFILLEQGEVWDMEMILGYFIQAGANNDRPVRLNKFEFIQTVVEGDRAWTSYWNWATFKNGEEVVRDIKWLESATAVKTKDGWRLDMLHSTRVDE